MIVELSKIADNTAEGSVVLHSVLNNTKWDELRLAVYSLDPPGVRWRTKDLSGYICQWDSEWFYHFRNGGYESIEWVEIQLSSPGQDAAILALLQEIHLPGHRIEGGFRVYGHIPNGATIDYI
jgi:hypothetical protein